MESKASQTTLLAKHVGITVSSIDNALAFWNGVLGLTTCATVEPSAAEQNTLTETLTGVKGAKVKLAHVKITEDFVVKLIEYTSSPAENGVTIKSKPNVPGTMYLSLQVADLDGVLEKGKKLGWEMVDGTGVITLPQCGPSAGSRVVFLKGPNQEMVELVEAPGDKAVKGVKGSALVEEIENGGEEEGKEEESAKKSDEEVKDKKKVVETILIDDC
ncbi:VOC family protein [Aspergillus ibericus CBS 121593]|uniref:VOC domain-containing protein n=1 Tax=Aspergillus ibericus CBS 121593 TaxID=1448316 RepID=A0A395GJR8_9EURO|nr:hypothetical protein BO80DRAFT_429718 [Aspergillus ibericus CBS 121593]RAK95614.1 hypothetical protein BO80DRAFT_429718 [Aspergillus ibericus CBS 121593]